ncbi:type II toxin-antitoxin system VapC family toxin, partial [Lyngbya confervoides]
MLLIDTSVWILIFRDPTGQVKASLTNLIGEQEVVLSRFTQLELLQGCRDEREWVTLQNYLQGQDYLEPTEETWELAARIYFDLRRQGKTVRSSIDCCIAQLAIENKSVLVHCDRDFEPITKVRSLQTVFFSADGDGN